MKSIIFFISSSLFISHVTGACDNEIKILREDIKNDWANSTYNEYYKYIEKVYEVPQDHHFCFILVDSTSRDFECTHMTIFTNGSRTHDGKNIVFKVSSVYAVGGTWICSMRTKNQESVIISLRLRVQNVDPPQLVLVNGMVLKTNIDAKNNVFTAKYIYQINDNVRMECISLDKKCPVNIMSRFRVDFDRNDIWSKAFSIKLTSAENKLEIQCISNCSTVAVEDPVKVINVTFVMRTKIASVISVKINNHEVSQHVVYSNSFPYYINYGFSNDNQAVKVMCVTTGVLDVSCERCRDLKQDKDTTLTLVPSMVSNLICKVNSSEQEVIITFTCTTCNDFHSTLPTASTIPSHRVSTHAPFKEIIDTPTSIIPLPTSQTETTSVNAEIWFAVGITVSILAILICVSTIKYKTKKQNDLVLAERDNTCRAEAASSNPAQSSSKDTVSEGVICENTLYTRVEDFYSKVMPKNKRKNKPGNVYAIPNVPEEFEEDTELQDLTNNVLYSVPLHKRNEECTNLKPNSNIYSVPQPETSEIYTNVTGGSHYSNHFIG